MMTERLNFYLVITDAFRFFFNTLTKAVGSFTARAAAAQLGARATEPGAERPKAACSDARQALGAWIKQTGTENEWGSVACSLLQHMCGCCLLSRCWGLCSASGEEKGKEGSANRAAGPQAWGLPSCAPGKVSDLSLCCCFCLFCPLKSPCAAFPVCLLLGKFRLCHLLPLPGDIL